MSEDSGARRAGKAMGRSSAVLVLGPHRGGTSCMANLLGRLGFEVGRDLLGSHACNLKGLWENQAVVAFNEELLSSCGSAWFDPSFVELDEISSAQEGALARLQGLLRSQYPISADIVIKDPRLSRMGAAYEKALEALGYRVRWVVALRHPSECADSLYRRDGIPRPVGQALWISHMLAALRAARGKDCCVLSYDALICHPDKTLRDLAEWVSPHSPIAPETLQSLNGCIDPGLRHSRRESPSASGPGRHLFDLAEAIFRHLQSAVGCGVTCNDTREWEARYRGLISDLGWCRASYRLVCYQAPESVNPAVSAVLLAALSRVGILMVRDGGDEAPLDQSLVHPMETGQIGLFYNLGVRDEAASLVRGIALRAGRGVLLLRQGALPRLSLWLNWLDMAEIPQNRVLTWGGSDASDPEAVFVPETVAVRLDPWIYVQQGPDALHSFLEAVRSLEGCSVESRTGSL